MNRALSPLSRGLLTVGGLGNVRPAPGTWGSLPPVALAGFLLAVGWFPGDWEEFGSAPSLAYHGILFALCAVFSAACMLFGDTGELEWGKKDPGSIVADETAGMCIALLALPIAPESSWPRVVGMLVLAFLAFRAMDILKPWPCSGLQRLPGGLGILIDDLVAGAYALVVVQVVGRVPMM